MASSLNKVFLLGNLTREPDLRYLPNGTGVCEFGLAVNRRFISNGKEIDETCFVDIVVWGRAAENCKQFLEKGSQVLVEGRLQYDQWEDRNGGGKRSRLRVVADQIQFMNRRDNNNSNYGQGDSNNSQERSDYANHGESGSGFNRNDQSSSRGFNGNNYQQNGGQMSRNYVPKTSGGMQQAPQQQMPPMPPQDDFNSGAGMEDDIPF